MAGAEVWHVIRLHNRKKTTLESIKLSSSGKVNSIDIPLSSSKSESNRVLIINALSGSIARLKNLSDARDTQTMQRLLASDAFELDVLDAGTTMRFLTAYLSVTADERHITGTPRMQKRPIKLLVDALRKLGADINYLNEEGYPPLKIKKFENQKVEKLIMPGNVSSQYISALLMIAPSLKQGLTIELTGEIYSRPYISMTLGLMSHFGAEYTWDDHVIRVNHQQYKASEYTVESDWSGASYWYSIVALAQHQDTSVKLLGLRKDSFQGDIAIADIMTKMGVKSEFLSDGVVLTKTKENAALTIDFKACPDLAQTVLTIAAVKNIKLTMTGLESLRIKETDRIAAMQNELAKIGGKLIEEGSTWFLTSSFGLKAGTIFDTYEDHRMAMALAPLALINNIVIEDPTVVNKSYPNYWKHLKMIGIEID